MNAELAVQANMSMSATQELFKQIAPSYDATYILAHLTKKFSDVQDSVLCIRIGEFLKFMFISSMYRSGFIPLTGEIDDIWHEFILQTNEYDKFCKALPSAKFIHHNSLHLEDFSKDKSKQEVIKELIEWLPLYFQHFGVFAEDQAQYWFIVGFLKNEFKLSLDQINLMAKEAAQRLSL